jgi:hypothetical protein
MSDRTIDLVRRYVAGWNEPDQERRRGALSRLWDPATVGDRAPWPSRDGFVFRPTAEIVGQRNTLRFAWDLVPGDGGTPVARGFDFVVLDGAARITAAHRFARQAPHSARLNALADRFVALWHEPLPRSRERGVAAGWTPDGILEWYGGQSSGHRAITAFLTAKYEHVVNRGFVFRRIGNAAADRGVVQLDWELVPTGGGAPVGVGVDLLFLVEDGSGRIRTCYEFCTPPVV